jgi:hypothetical protein
MQVLYSWPSEYITNDLGKYPRTIMKVFEDQPNYNKVSTYNDVWGVYNTQPLYVSLYRDDFKVANFIDNRYTFRFRIDPRYRQCCGLREIGCFEFVSNPNYKEIIETIIDAFSKGIITSDIGALTYTLVRYNEDYYQDKKAALLMQAWPGASAGDWWYNPNSGNEVQIWTLPINQDRQNAVEDDD